MEKIKIGFAPTRRSIFSAPDAVKYADLTRAKLDEMGVSYVDIKDINEEGLLYDDNARIKIALQMSNSIFLMTGGRLGDQIKLIIIYLIIINHLI